MFRISSVFETSSVVITKVAGQISDAELDSWSDFLASLAADPNRWLVLDFGDVSQVGPLSAERLIQSLPANVLLLNCPTGIKNMADSKGLCQQVLEPTCGKAQPRCQCFLNFRQLQPSGGES